MKSLKRILCFILMFVTLGFFTACSKSETPPATKGPEISQGGGGEETPGEDTGSGEEQEPEVGPSDEPSDEPEEVYVPYTSSEIMLLGSNFINGYLDEFEADESDEELFDDNINEMRVLFLNASKMIKSVSRIENLTYGACLQGNVLTLDDYNGKPNAVAKFYITFSEEDAEGNSSVRIRLLFSYNGLDVSYDYDYYEMLIETNKAKKLVSCEISVEKSAKKDGLNDSTADYFVLELDGGIESESSEILVNVYKFKRTEMVDAQTQIDFNIIDNLAQSKFNGKTNFYVDGEDAELLLRKASSEQSLLVAQRVGGMYQGLKRLSGTTFGTIPELSENLVVYVDAETEIV